MKKEYTRPTVVKVELNHEQAVLGTCSTGVTSTVSGGRPYCSPAPVCKQKSAGNELAHS